MVNKNGGSLKGLDPKNPIMKSAASAPVAGVSMQQATGTPAYVDPGASYGSTPSYSSGSFGSVGGAAPMVTAPTDEDYLAGDSGFVTQNSALQAALQRYLADADFQKTNYETDYKKGVRDLGYDETAKTWNRSDPLTASGRGYRNITDDYAGRGMLQSSAFADANTDFERMLGQQFDSLAIGKTTFNNDLDRQIANYKGENTSNIQAAKAEALQRRAAQYAL